MIYLLICFVVAFLYSFLRISAQRNFIIDLNINARKDYAFEWCERLLSNVLTRTKGLSKKNILIAPTAPGAPTAFVVKSFAGEYTIFLNPFHVSSYTDEMVESIIGHELGHIKHADQTIMSLSNNILFSTWMTTLFSVALGTFLGSQYLIYAVVLFVIYVPLFLLERSYSRWAEYRADSYCLQTVKHPTAFLLVLADLMQMENFLNTVQGSRQGSGLFGDVLLPSPPLMKRFERCFAQMHNS